MASFNKVILVGNLTRDVDVRRMPNGNAVTTLGVAVNRNWKTSEGEKREETTFVDVEVFGKHAEHCGQYLRKGRRVLVEGRLQLDQWEDKQTGAKRSKLSVVGENIQFLTSAKPQGEETGEAEAEEHKPF